MSPRNRRLAALAIALAFAAACAPPGPSAEPVAQRPGASVEGVAIGHEVRLDSSLLEEERTLYVSLPESYAAAATKRHPVLYLLDAESDFRHTAGIVEFLAGIDRIPELIVVGVVNTNRSRDLTPPSSDIEETAFWDEVGGAELFRRFLREELIPFVDRSYRTEPYRILRGQSFGGLFALHDYMSAEPVFDAALTSSPAVGWNHGQLIEAAPAFFAAGVPRPLYVASAGKDFPGSLENIHEFVRIVETATAASDTATWRHDTFPAEGHYTLDHLATYRALEFVYAPWPVPDEVAASADFAAYERHFARLSERYGYPIPIPMRSIVRVGNQLLRERKFDKGISVFEQALRLYEGLPEAHWRVGEAYRLAGRLAEARPHFERAYALAKQQSVPDLADYEQTLESLDAELRPAG